jgi:hypothetical protein
MGFQENLRGNEKQKAKKQKNKKSQMKQIR